MLEVLPVHPILHVILTYLNDAVTSSTFCELKLYINEI